MKYFSLFSLLLLTGCAVLDISTLDTAIPIEANHVQIKYLNSAGLELSTTVITDSELENDPDVSEYGAGMWPVVAWNAAIGLRDQADIGARFWLSTDSRGGKLYYKKLMHQEGNTYLSLVPAINFVEGTSEDWETDERYHSLGGELQLLYTYKAGEYFRFTAAIRANYNRYTESTYDSNGDLYEQGPFNIVHWGTRANVMLKLGPLMIIPELGAEMVPVVNGEIDLLPTVGLGVGLEL